MEKTKFRTNEFINTRLDKFLRIISDLSRTIFNNLLKKGYVLSTENIEKSKL